MLKSTGSRVCRLQLCQTSLVAPRHMESSQTRTPVSLALAGDTKETQNAHWTSREVWGVGLTIKLQHGGIFGVKELSVS